MPQLQVQRTEVGIRRSSRQGSALRGACPVLLFIGDGPSEVESTEWLVARFNIDARSDDQLSLIQLTLLRQARAALEEQIELLEKRLGKLAGARRSIG